MIKVNERQKEMPKRETLGIDINWFKDEDICKYTNEKDGKNLHFLLTDRDKIDKVGSFVSVDLSNVTELDFSFYRDTIDYDNYGSNLINREKTIKLMEQVNTKLFNIVKDIDNKLEIQHHNPGVAITRAHNDPTWER